jgi:hypothetical protein
MIVLVGTKKINREALNDRLNFEDRRWLMSKHLKKSKRAKMQAGTHKIDIFWSISISQD